MKTPMRTRFLLLSLCLFSLLINACSGADKIDTNTAEGAFALAQKYQEDERYEEAKVYYQEVKNKHPYSRFAILSELALADLEYEREAYAEAEANYRLFKELHPRHEKSDYVTYRLAMSIFNQVPSTIDRDLADANRSIIYFDEVLTSYPESKYAVDAAKSKADAQRMLAEKVQYIAHFYFIREEWLSALGRYKDLLTHPKSLGYEKDALYGAAISAHRLKEQDQAKSYLAQLQEKFPKSSKYNSARKEILGE